MDADVKPDYSLPDDDDLADLAKTNTVSEKPKRKKRGLKKKDKQALGVGRRATVRHEPQSPKQRYVCVCVFFFLFFLFFFYFFFIFLLDLAL